MGRTNRSCVYTSDETGCVNELARRIVAHVGEGAGVKVRVVVMHGDVTGLVDELKRVLVHVRVDVEHIAAHVEHRLRADVSVSVGGRVEWTCKIHIVERRVVVTEVRVVLKMYLNLEALTPGMVEPLESGFELDLAAQLNVPVTYVDVRIPVVKVRGDDGDEVNVVAVIRVPASATGNVVVKASSIKKLDEGTKRVPCM
jgi:hypothetical protein